MSETQNQSTPQAKLTLFRSMCIIVGVIVGSGIFGSPPAVASNTANWWNLPPEVWVLLAWLLGGVISLLGALCYAELATAYPKQGGDYHYLTQSYGRWSGFLFGWARLAIVQAASIGAIAYVFGDYATKLYSLGSQSATMYAVAAIVVLTIINIVGVTAGALTQNILTIAKVVGLGVVFVVAFMVPHGAGAAEVKPLEQSFPPSFGLALVLVLWTYGGWNEIAYVAAEVKDPKRNILRSLVFGLAAVTIIYLLVNAAFLYSLGYEGLKASEAVAANVLQARYGAQGARFISALVMVSALGALNGFIFTSPRVYYAMGREHRIFAALGRWHERFGTPVAALVLQCVLILVLVGALLIAQARWGSGASFETMVYLTGGVFWGFMAMTGLSLFVLRIWDTATERPYKVLGYPVVPFLFVCLSLYMFSSSLSFKPFETLIGAIIVLVGFPLYWISEAMERASGEPARD
jgi:amino acid transporter